MNDQFMRLSIPKANWATLLAFVLCGLWLMMIALLLGYGWVEIGASRKLPSSTGYFEGNTTLLLERHAERHFAHEDETGSSDPFGRGV